MPFRKVWEERMRTSLFVLTFVLGSLGAFAQEPQNGNRSLEPAETKVVLSPGTHILLVVKSPISTRSARDGDGVYLESAFPVVAGGRVVVPEGTAFQGTVRKSQRSGKLKGRATLLLRIDRMIYRSGYVVEFNSTVQSTPGTDGQRVANDEGTIEADSTRGKDAVLATAAGLAGGYAGAGTGALVGALANGSPRIGGAIGGGAGLAMGLIAVLAMRGREVQLEPGSNAEIVLQSPIEIDTSRVGSLEGHHEAFRAAPVERTPTRPVRPRLPFPFPRM
jgi:hypothetical protein